MHIFGNGSFAAAQQAAQLDTFAQNVQNDWLSRYNDYNQCRNYLPLCAYPLPKGWSDWYNIGDELI